LHNDPRGTSALGSDQRSASDALLSCLGYCGITSSVAVAFDYLDKTASRSMLTFATGGDLPEAGKDVRTLVGSWFDSAKSWRVRMHVLPRAGLVNVSIAEAGTSRRPAVYRTAYSGLDLQALLGCAAWPCSVSLGFTAGTSSSTSVQTIKNLGINMPQAASPTASASAGATAKRTTSSSSTGSSTASATSSRTLGASGSATGTPSRSAASPAASREPGSAQCRRALDSIAAVGTDLAPAVQLLLVDGPAQVLAALGSDLHGFVADLQLVLSTVTGIVANATGAVSATAGAQLRAARELVNIANELIPGGKATVTFRSSRTPSGPPRPLWRRSCPPSPQSRRAPI